MCFFTAIVVSLCATLTALAVNPPELTGRIVDQANIIPAATRSTIEPKLADLETKSGIQLVVATVTSLDGEEIEPYANELFRTWKLGEKTKNNGVLLLVAPKEQRVRIEVGYGLEGTLTDALSKVIITNAIAPRFKAGDFGGGISRGVDDIITVLTTDASEWQQRPSLRARRPGDPRSVELAHRCRDHRARHAAHRVARFPLVLPERGAEHPPQFGRFARRRVLVAVAVAVLRRRRLVGRRRGIGELVMNISEQDRERISAAIRAAESKTSGEIVCVLAQTSSDATGLPILLAALVALALPWLLVAFTAMSVHRILLLQAVVFFVLAVVLCLPRVRVALVPRAARRAVAHRVAMEQFSVRGIARKKDRSGILIFVSLAEHYARIIADDGIARVPQAEWQGAVDTLVANCGQGASPTASFPRSTSAGTCSRPTSPAPATAATSCRTAST